MNSWTSSNARAATEQGWGLTFGRMVNGQYGWMIVRDDTEFVAFPDDHGAKLHVVLAAELGDETCKHALRVITEAQR